MANLQIPNLPAAIALNGTEQYEAVQAGVSVRVNTAQIADYIAAQYPPVGVLLPQSITASTATTTIDWRSGTYCVVTLAANTTIVFSPIPPASWIVSMTVLFVQDGTGNWTVTYTPTVSGFITIYTEDGNQPLINPAAGARSELQNILDPARNVLRIRQGVIGELALP